jgi:hypothetical protein
VDRFADGTFIDYSLLTIRVQRKRPITPDHDRIDVPDRRSDAWCPVLGMELELKASMANIAQLCRGLLYSGGIAITGSELERGELAKKLRDLAIDVTGHVIEGLGILKSIVEIINWVDANRPLEAVVAAQEVERYLSMYSAVLTQWAFMAL